MAFTTKEAQKCAEGLSELIVELHAAYDVVISQSYSVEISQNFLSIAQLNLKQKQISIANEYNGREQELGKNAESRTFKIAELTADEQKAVDEATSEHRLATNKLNIDDLKVESLKRQADLLRSLSYLIAQQSA